MPSQPVLLLLGAGPKLGVQISSVFAQAGYAIVLVARSLEEGVQDNGHYHIKADFSEPSTIPDIFATAKKVVGAPTVVVYNAVQYILDDAEDPFSSLSPSKVSQLHTAVAVNGTSPLISLYHAIESFRSLGDSEGAGKTFIFTGNILNHSQFKNRLCFGLGKTMCAYGVRFASVAYAGQSFSFYYADERTPDGLPVMRDIDGEVAGKEYLKLAQTPGQLPWLYTYTKDEGYKGFGEADYLKSVDTDDPHFVQGGRWQSKPRVSPP